MEKWFFIAGGAALVAMFAGLAISDVADKQATRDIIVACYNTHQPNCEKLWR